MFIIVNKKNGFVYNCERAAKSFYSNNDLETKKQKSIYYSKIGEGDKK